MASRAVDIGVTPRPAGCADGELSQLFPTVLFKRRHPEAKALNPRLRDIILAHERADPGVRHSNVGGWHSSANLHDWPEPDIQQFCQWVLAAARDLTASVVPLGPTDEIKLAPYGGCWANVLRDGGYNKIHNHPGAVWSAVYYVAAGNPDPGHPGNGMFEFMDPRPGNIHGGKEVIDPEPGLLMIFPSWLYHYVNPFRGSGERISIACNLSVEISRPAPRP